MSRLVFTFLQAFLGDRAAAEDLAYQVTMLVLRQTKSDALEHSILLSALTLALRTAESYRAGGIGHDPGAPLEIAIRRLPAAERAVLILRNLLGMDWADVAVVASASSDKARQTWRTAVTRLTELLQRDFSKERS
ncbi:MAG: hypothetical protein JST79_18145 [Acidobacteria bacterium]|nr:hypothetical protein [Acidobacteriota bacterium]